MIGHADSPIRLSVLIVLAGAEVDPSAAERSGDAARVFDAELPGDFFELRRLGLLSAHRWATHGEMQASWGRMWSSFRVWGAYGTHGNVLDRVCRPSAVRRA